MRLIGIGLLAFLLAGLALLLARSEMLSHTMRAVQTLTQGPQLRFETPMASEAKSGADQAIIRRAGSAAPIILSGLPAYQGAVFHMPIDARPTSGYLQIDATSQVLEGVEGVLRVSIDNIRRAEVLLHPGEALRSVRIELTAADIAQAQLVVSFSLQGTGANPVCTSDHAVLAVVEIETTSALFLSLDAPLISPRDRVSAWGNQMRLIWDGETQALLSAVHASRAGASVMFVPSDGLSGADVASLLRKRQSSQASSGRPEFAWSEAMAQDGGLYGLRRFQRSHTWRLRYDMAQALSANLPEALALSMIIPRHVLGADWQVTVTLDGRLLAHFSGTADQTQLEERITIPARAGLAHTIEITVTSAVQTEGPCHDGPEVLAEILPDTRIYPSQDMAQDPLRTLSAALAERAHIVLAASDKLNSAEANVAVELLHALLPHDQVARFSGASPAITVLPRGAALPAYPQDSHWVVYRSADGALRAEPAITHAGRDLSAVALLVDIDAGTT
jgi:hypothetical protein